jgi:hypothetical protein
MKTANKGNPILVTGTHRSGSMWVDKMLAMAPSQRKKHCTVTSLFVYYLTEVFWR